MLIEIKDEKQKETIELLAVNGITAVPTSAYKKAIKEYVEDSMNNMESKLICIMTDEEFEKSVEYITDNIVNSSEDAFDESFLQFMIINGLSELSKNSSSEDAID